MTDVRNPRSWSGRLRFVAGLALGALLAGGITYAAIPDSATGKITACVMKAGATKGAVRIIDPSTGAACTAAEQLIRWQSNAPRYRGAWTAADSYVKDDIVTRLGASYIAKAASTNVAPPNATKWATFAAAGAAGAQGDPGAPGPQYGQVMSLTRAIDTSAGTMGYYASMAIGVDGNPVISYQDATNRNLKLAVCNDPTCISSAIKTLDSTGDVGSYSSVTIGSDGLPTISYFDSTGGNLKTAVCDDPACSTWTLSLVHNVGSDGYTSITIGTNGFPVISYYDAIGKDLKLASCNNRLCDFAFIRSFADSANMVGSNSSITIGTDGNPIIAYHDATNSDLKFAACANPSCSTSTLRTVDSAATVSNNLSMTISVDGNPIIAYQDSLNSDLKVASCNDPTCGSAVLRTVDTTGDSGLYPSITVGPSGNPIISHYDNLNGDLRFVECGDPTCTTSTSRTLDTAGNVGYDTTITIGSNGAILVSYQDATNGDLKLAVVAHRSWHPNGWDG